MQKVKVLALFAVLAAIVVAVLRRRELAAAGEWQTLGTTSPASSGSPTAPASPVSSVPESQDEIDIERGVAEGLPVSDRFAATPDPTSDPLPEGYDPLTDPIPPNEL